MSGKTNADKNRNGSENLKEVSKKPSTKAPGSTSTITSSTEKGGGNNSRGIHPSDDYEDDLYDIDDVGKGYREPHGIEFPNRHPVKAFIEIALVVVLIGSIIAAIFFS